MSDKTANVAFLEADTRVFESYALKPRTRELRLQKPTLAVRIVEVGTGEPALFLHGFSLCTAHWAPLMARLPSLHRIAIDMPGHGASEGVDYRGVDLRRWYRDMLTCCLDELGLASADIIGHSQGAMLGMWLALDAPERVRSLVAIGTPAVALGARLENLKILARHGIGSFMLSMPKPPFMYRRILADTIGRHAVDVAPKGLIRTTYLATRQADFGKTVSTYLAEMFTGVGAEPPRYVLRADELAKVHQPVLMLWGQDDHTQPIAEAKTKAALMPNARFEVVPGGHEPWLDDLETCAELVSAFLLQPRTSSRTVATTEV
ncbi:MAG TPA: alpha/beta hydrolase [Gemmatimonadaceae bacterium]|nr:alpha/beta hydrolase [Gemmatimonadaceae bacterium]